MNNKSVILASLFSALIIVGAFIRFPLPPVPITLQTLFVILSGMLLGPKLAFFSTMVYLILGSVGLPVFSAGGGLGVLLGPTGGYLFGLLPAALIAGIAGNFKAKEEHPNHYFILCLLFGLLATIAVYAVGVPFLKLSRSLSWANALKGGMFPFLLGDFLKLLVAAQLARTFNVRIKAFIGQGT